MRPRPPASPLFPYTTLFRSGRLEKMMLYSFESTVARTYLDWMIHVPWSKRTRDNLEVKRAEEILNADHYEDRKSTRLNSSHRTTSYAVFCLKKKKSNTRQTT